MTLLTHEEQPESGSSVTSSLEEDLGQGLTGDRASDGRDITQGKHDDDQKGETEGSTIGQSLCYSGCENGLLEHDTVNPVRKQLMTREDQINLHSSGNAHLWPDSLFGHGRKHTGGREAVSALDQSENPALHR